jgi:hypothetical protein
MATLISSLTAVALAAGTGTTGAATTASTPDALTGIAPAFIQQHPQPAPPPHRFRIRFRTEQQCRIQAAHDHPGRPGDWDCRPGPDRAHPWEYWGR